MEPVEIKVALLRKGVSMRSIARRLGVSVNAVSLVVHGRLGSPRIRKALAKAVEERVETLFPNEKGSRGNSLSRAG